MRHDLATLSAQQLAAADQPPAAGWRATDSSQRATSPLMATGISHDRVQEVFDLVGQWLTSYTDSPNTQRSYQQVAREWLSWCLSAGLDPLQARRAHVERYKADLFDKGKSARTVNQRLSAVSSFYNYAVDEELVGRNPTRGVRRPQLPDQAASTGLTRDELNALLSAASGFGKQLYALLTLLALNGLRASEPLGCTVEDLGTERGHSTLAVVRKGYSAPVRVPLAPVTTARLQAWLADRAELLGQGGRGAGLLFFKIHRDTGQRTPFDRRDLHRLVRQIGRQAIPHKTSIHPHDLRHAFVTLSLDAGVPLRDVQDSAGHASPVTTRRYDRGRGKIDRHATYVLATYLSVGEAAKKG